MPSRLMTRPTQPVPAQLTATRSVPPSAAWSTARWQSSGSVTSPPTYVATDLAGDLLGPVLVPVEDDAPGRRAPTRARAVAAPSPDAPPVTIAELFVEFHGARWYGEAPPSQTDSPTGRLRTAAPRWPRPRASSSTKSFQRSPAVALHPAERDLAVRVEGQLEQRLPQVPVGHRLAAGSCASPGGASPPTSGRWKHLTT